MTRGKDMDILKKGFWRKDKPKGKKIFKGLGIDVPLYPTGDKDRFLLRAKIQGTVFPNRIMKRFNPQTVPCYKNLLAGIIPQRKGKHSP